MTVTKANRVARKLDRRFPAVSNSFFLFFKELVLTMSREHEKDPAKEDELKIRRAGEFSPGPDELRDADAVFRNQLFCYGLRVLPLRDDPADVEPVAAGNILNGDLLYESLNGACLKAVRGRPLG